MSTPVVPRLMPAPMGDWAVWAQWPDSWILVRGTAHVDDAFGVVAHLLDQNLNFACTVQIAPGNITSLDYDSERSSSPLSGLHVPGLSNQVLEIRAKLRWVAGLLPIRGPSLLEKANLYGRKGETESPGLTVPAEEIEVYSLLGIDHPFWEPKEAFLEWVQTLPRSTR
jgi:hypothetical protein